MKITATALASVFVFASSAEATAQSISYADFAKHAVITEVTMAPDGKHIALSVPSADGMETQLQIVPLDGSKDVQALRFGRQQHVTDLIWSANDQIVVSRAKRDPLKTRPDSYGELMSSDVRGKTQNTLFAFVRDSGTISGRRKDKGFASVAMVLNNEPGKVLVDFSAWPDRIGDEDRSTTIYKVDTRTGSREQVEYSREPATFQFDHDGRARLKITRDGDDTPVLMYRPTPSSGWQSVPKALAGYSMSLIYVAADNNTAYASITDKDEPAQLYKVNLAEGTRVKLAGKDDEDISRVMFAGHDGPPFAVLYDEGKPSVQYLDPASKWASMHVGLLKAFPGQMVSFLNWSNDDSKLLFAVWGDRNPVAWYVLDTANGNKIQLIDRSMPWIKPESLAHTTPISFKTRDGLTLHGFLTSSSGSTPRPLVVMPHGGPHGIYDTWGYNSDAQFLASRGYSVLQVNYRGSGGRGRHFIESGYREWGGKMQDDLADGVRWAVDNHLADASRICTYGASYGGYAALMQPIRYPQLYKCAIGYVGVYDLQVMKKEGDVKDTASGRRYLDRVLGTDDAQLRAWSPAQNTNLIKVPVFIAQGMVDRRVPMEQFNALKSSFKSSGTPLETMLGSGEGHGFYKPENRIELYRRMEEFLGKHIGTSGK
ncbi:MAG: S9 family peptidase [Xanthomonadaceae bacterium]|nr:S9 family peptidase [Xanthomonadaceae bacterium]